MPYAKESSNALLLVVCGFILWMWLLFFTEWIPLTEGLLGLGGLFAWSSFIYSLVDKREKKRIQELIADKFLKWPGMRFWGVVGLAGILFFPQFGSVRFNTMGDDRNRTVIVQDESRSMHLGKKIASILTTPGKVRRELVWAGFFTREVYIRPTGLPGRRVRIQSLTATELYLPESFWRRPVLLIRPLLRMSANAGKSADLSLVVCRGKDLLGIIPSNLYQGQAVWVGCNEDVDIPEETLNKWRLELAENGLSGDVALLRWRNPMAVAPNVAFRAGDKITARLIHGDGMLYASGEAEIRPKHLSTKSVQELRLSYPVGPYSNGKGGYACVP